MFSGQKHFDAPRLLQSCGEIFKKRLGFVLAVSFLTLLIGGTTNGQVPTLYYDFENNTTRTVFENVVEQAVNGGSGAITRAGNTTTISAVAGAGTFNGGTATGQAATGSNWDSSTADPGVAATNYYQLVVNTSGFSQMLVAFDHQASATGPARVGVLYSTDGANFSASTTTLTGNAVFSAASFDLSGISAIDNQSSVTIRLYAFAGSAGDRIGRSAFASSGTFRIDNLVVLARTATSSATLLNYPAIGLSIKSGTAFIPTYTDFTLSGPGTSVALASELRIGGTLALLGGDITTGAFNLVMGSGATSTGNGDVVGNVSRSDLGGGNTRSFGNPNVQITIAAGSVTGLTVNLIKASPSDFGNSIRRTYTLKDVIGTLVTATVRLHYLDSELNDNSEETLELWRKDGGNWVSQGAATRDSMDNWVEKTMVTGFSPWTIAGPVGPTYIAMVGYSATRGKDGKVRLEWETGQEVNNLGFNIYRDVGGRRTRINKSLILGSALMARPGTVMSAGRSYLWQSSGATYGDTEYWIEEIDLNGSRLWHGPIVAHQLPDGMTALLPSQQAVADQTVTLEDLAAEGAQVGLTLPVQTPFQPSNSTAAEMSLQHALAAQDAVKISVNQEGWYRIGKPELVAAGLNPNAEPGTLQLFADGVETPITITPDPLKFDSASAIEFYAVGLDTPSTDQRVYWLVSAKSAGKRIATVQGGGGLPPANSFLSTVERRDRLIYLSGVHNGDAENFFGTPVGSESVDQTVILRNVDTMAPGQASLEIGMQGFSLTPHNVAVTLNGTALGAIQYDGNAPGVKVFPVSNNLLTEGQNVVTLTGQHGVLDVSAVDHIQVSYWRTYSAYANALRFTAQGSQRVTISGFTSADVRVLDVTNPREPSVVAAVVERQDSEFVVTLGVPGAGDRTLVAFGGDQVRSPREVKANQRSTWRTATNQADLVIITNSLLNDSFSRLAALRRSQGLKVATVDVEDIYDEFNFGNKSPHAIKDFLLYANNSWKKAPNYVLLAGSASYDPKNYNGFGNYDLVPTKLADTFFMETSSDDWFADFNLDGIAELAVGRLPAHTPEEATNIVAKLIEYESSAPQHSALLVADDNLGFDFEQATNQLPPLFPTEISVQQINRRQISTAVARQQLLDGIASGQKVVNYAGHGSPSGWRGGLLTSADAPAFTNTGRYPLFVLMTCLNGFFQHPGLNSLATALMNAREAGAVAVWASSGLTGPAQQSLMNQRFYDLLFELDRHGQGPRLGDATTRAKQAVNDVDVKRTWVLFGDPSMRLR